MKVRFLVLIGVLIAVVGIGAALPSVADAQTGNAKAAARTLWGDPDLQGEWTNTTATRLERPDDLKDKAVLSEEELAEQNQQAAARVDQRPRAGALHHAVCLFVAPSREEQPHRFRDEVGNRVEDCYPHVGRYRGPLPLDVRKALS